MEVEGGASFMGIDGGKGEGGDAMLNSQPATGAIPGGSGEGRRKAHVWLAISARKESVIKRKNVIARFLEKKSERVGWRVVRRKWKKFYEKKEKMPSPHLTYSS